jgi:hypothetical protein
LKKRKILPILILILILFASENNLKAQFYNGHQMTFGKNRVQYSNNFWRYHRYDRYDTYYTKDAEEMALTVSEIATKKIDEIETFFGYGLQKRIIFLCYKRLSDFRQSNVGYDSGNENSNIGGVTQIVDNKVFVYFEGDTKSLENKLLPE